jgi:hypothetical protein
MAAHRFALFSRLDQNGFRIVSLKVWHGPQGNNFVANTPMTSSAPACWVRANTFPVAGIDVVSELVS